jgi:hypothetical protein
MKKVLMMLALMMAFNTVAPVVMAAEGGECWYPPSGCRPAKPPR